MNTKPELKNKIICIVGPSGSGKTLLYDILRVRGYKVVDSYTTRPPRKPDELGHTFVTQEEFDALRGDFAAYTKFADYEYATTFEQLEGNQFYIIDPDGVKDLSEKIGRENFKVVYLSVGEMTRFVRMKKDRGEKEAFKRINHDAEKFKDFYDFDAIRQNGLVEDIENNIKFLITMYKASNSLEV